MRYVFVLVAAIALAFDFEVRGPYSVAYLIYAACFDAWHDIAWHFHTV